MTNDINQIKQLQETLHKVSLDWQVKNNECEIYKKTIAELEFRIESILIKHSNEMGEIAWMLNKIEYDWSLNG